MGLLRISSQNNYWIKTKKDKMKKDWKKDKWATLMKFKIRKSRRNLINLRKTT